VGEEGTQERIVVYDQDSWLGRIRCF